MMVATRIAVFVVLIGVAECFIYCHCKSKFRHLCQTKGTDYEYGNDPPLTGNAPPLANGKASSEKPRRGRKSPDYPWFAYDTFQRYPSSASSKADRRAQLMRIRFRGAATGTADGKKERTRLINVSRKMDQTSEKKGSVDDSTLPWWQRWANRLLYLDTDTVLPSARETRLLNSRAYARREPFEAENMDVPPGLDDLASMIRTPFEGFWISLPARFLTFALSYYAFPYLARFLDGFVTMEPEQLQEITSTFTPGISILYGTFISLTLSILYNRQRDIQENVALEASQLVLITRNLLTLFKDNKELALQAGQCAADQVRTLVKSSRGAELMLLMYSDPYARMLELIAQYEELQAETSKPSQGSTQVSYSRDVLKDLIKFRANRLSDEALALPPTHFLILTTLTILILVGYTASILPTVEVPPNTGEPSRETSVMFALLTTTYILFDGFVKDLNDPFTGVYQLRRSAAATQLLEAKWLIVNHPYLQGQIDFEEPEQEDDPQSAVIKCPGLGDCRFERDDIFLDGPQT